VPAGESRIEADFARTRDRTAGGWLSAAAAAGSLAMLLRARRARREA